PRPMQLAFEREEFLRCSERGCRGGTFDNSPTFQRWVNEFEASRVPKGRLMEWVRRPFGTRACSIRPVPNVETLDYYQMSLRDRGSAWFIQLIYSLQFLVALGIVFLTLGAAFCEAALGTEVSRPGVTNDAWCAPTNLISPRDPLRPQAMSTLKMIERLKQLRENADPRANPFLSNRRAELMERSLLSMTNLTLEQEMNFRCKLGIELVQAGRSADALHEYEAVEHSAAHEGVELLENSKRQLRTLKTQALLRLGEQENCLVNHNSNSCLFPLLPSAYHRLPRGSRGAIELLTEQLGKYPDDLSARWLLNLAFMT